ncbi:MAG: translocation/assembly module TamB, partial [Halomonas sp.]|nr:translocation/assembly module TamB [Halomonas sp.]
MQLLSTRQRLWLFGWSLFRLLIWLPLWLLALLMLVLGLVLAPWGTGFLLSQAEKHDVISVEYHEGGLLDDFRLQGFAMDAFGVNARIGEFELVWADDCLLSGKLCLDTLRVVDADIRLSPSGEAEAPPPEPEEQAPAGEISLPFPIELRKLALDN